MKLDELAQLKSILLRKGIYPIVNTIISQFLNF